MIILPKAQREEHINIIEANTDSPIAVPPGKRYLLFHLSEVMAKTKTGIYLAPGSEQDLKPKYRQYPPGIGLIIAISGHPKVSDADISKLREQCIPGEWHSAGNIDQIEVGDYVRFDPMSAFEVTDQFTGMKKLLVYQNEMLSIITTLRIQDNHPPKAEEDPETSA